MTPAMSSLARTREIAQGIRRRVLAHVVANNGGYLSQACSSAEILATLYHHIMNLGPSEGPEAPPPFVGAPGPGRPAQTGAAYNGAAAPDLDRFIFSPVHYALTLYATLIETGRMGESALDQFNVDGSTVELIGAEHSPGHEVTAGSLAQAISQAGGIALARRLRGDTGKVWVFISDGELQEGQTWEAMAAFAFHRLDNIAVVIDANGHQCDGVMDRVMTIEPAVARLEAFGACAREVDGHDVESLVAAASTEHPGRPLVIVARTDARHGIALLEERATKLHHVRFRSDDERQRYAELLQEWQA
jgi:transketolase